jgi:metallo-beta-lactamase family protein
MKLTFIGADHEVTGSCHYLEIAGKHLAVDCGMEQGADIYENAELPIPASELDYVLLTHAHIDHSGYLPLLYSHGFRGVIYSTKATADLCQIMLRDSAHIQEMEAEWKNRKARRSGLPEVAPMYSIQDAENVTQHFHAVDYDTVIDIADGIQVRFSDVGHLLGSASIEIWATEDNHTVKLAFSGDIGNVHQPLIRDPQFLSDADYVIMESTYGDRSHGNAPDYIQKLTEILRTTFGKGGNVVIPSFAVGRTQELLYFIREIKSKNLLPEYSDFEVYVDSPLAIEATNVFNRNVESCFDEEAMALVRQGINPIAFPGLKTAVTSDESKAINFNPTPKVIISASGMCEAGRIRHHLKHNLWRPECTILFVGYQANGTLGRALVEGVSTVTLFGETINIEAKIERLEGISGHADKEHLIEWLDAMSPKPKTVFVVHGEDNVCDTFVRCLNEEHGYHAVAPYTGASFDLIRGEFITEGNQTKKLHEATVSTKSPRAAAIYQRLIAAGQRLMTVIRHNEGGTNKDLSKFTDQINSLCDKWDR